ncbi:MAG: two-component system sensor kinase FixL [Parasphingorhabdus sp.]|jgi:two-component system sensor kinase FixL
MIHHLPGMVYQCLNQPERPLEFVSEGCKVLCGFSRNELETSLTLWDKLIHEDDREAAWSQIQQAVSNQDNYAVEYRIKTKATGLRWVIDLGVRSPTDEACLEGFIVDITERKNTELALSEQHTYAEAVVETAVEAIISFDSNGAIETLNTAAQQMFGYSLKEIRGENLRVLIPQPDHSAHDEYISYYLTTNEQGAIGNSRDASAQRKDGTAFPIHISVGEMAHSSKRRFVGLIRDISRQRDAELEARQHREQLAHMDRLNMLGEMATGIAHEINQPLTAISLFAQAAKRLVETANYERLPDTCDKLSQHAQRAGAVIERVQAMSRQHKSTKEITDCNALMEEVAKLAESDALLRNISIEVDVDTEISPVAVDPIQIQQVMLNLLRNGMEAMRSVNCRYGNSIQLQTSLCENGDVEIAVIDRGCGVSKDAANTLFTSFSSSKKTGMGMGLSISQAIITAHGGQLEFRDNATEGATFFFILPVAEHGELDG